MARHTLDGKIVEIGEGQSWPSGFSKVTAIIAEGGSDRDPDQIPVEFTRSAKGGDDNIALLDQCAVGDTVRITYVLRVREWQGRHFLNISATGLERLASAPPQDAPEPTAAPPAEQALPGVPPPPPQAPAPVGPVQESLDDLPF